MRCDSSARVKKSHARGTIPALIPEWPSAAARTIKNKGHPWSASTPSTRWERQDARTLDATISYPTVR